jgi:hypothetical protein
MSDYKITVGNINDISVDVSKISYEVSLARVGSQGSKGDTIESAYISEDDLIFVMSNSNGDTYEITVSGFITDLSDAHDHDNRYYTETEIDHKFATRSTSDLTDIDNTLRSDGAVLIYNGESSKYMSTTTINNPNTTITGGSY